MDLEELPRFFDGPLARVVLDQGAFYLESTEFDQLADATAVQACASALLPNINGAARLHFRGFRPVRLGPIIEDLAVGKRIAVTVTETMTLRMKVDAVLVAGPGGHNQPPPAPSPSNTWLAAALNDDPTRHVLRILSARELGWFELYKLMEVLEANDGTADRQGLGISNNQLRRFTRTANSMGALGDLARHATNNTQPPADPMSIEEARNLIQEWTRAWLLRRS